MLFSFSKWIFIFCIGIVLPCNGFSSQADTITNPLSAYSKKWETPRFQSCNTAAAAGYLTEEEKNLIWVLNMIRLDPKLFLYSVLYNPTFQEYKKIAAKNSYYLSLIEAMKRQKPITDMLIPDSACFLSARCHAIQAGKAGFVGHSRLNSGCPYDFRAECCDYGSDKALNILVHLLIDEGVESLGHRKICLSPGYNLIGVSIQPHQAYGRNAVLDFK